MTVECQNGASEVRWAARVKKSLLRRLYENDAKGIVDEKLIEEVGYGLYARCRSIIDVYEARQGRIRCPRCDRMRTDTVFETGRAEIIQCPVCGWATTWSDYCRTFRRQQLNSGGALEAFTGYLRRFDVARTPRERLFAIDHVIHEFHYSLRASPDTPTRAAGVNLIEGKLTDVMEFLDGLSQSDATAETLARWREAVGRVPWNPLR